MKNKILDWMLLYPGQKKVSTIDVDFTYLQAKWNKEKVTNF